MNKNNMIFLCDSRQQKDRHITNFFDKNNIIWCRDGLKSADYMAIRYDEEFGMYKDFSLLIDTKKNILEMSANLTRTSEHERVKREIFTASELGCERFIFLIANNDIIDIDGVKNWSDSKTKVKGETLAKIMHTFEERYGVEFMFCKKSKMGEVVYNLFSSQKNKKEEKE